MGSSIAYRNPAGTNIAPTMGHSVDEMDWSQTIPTINANNGIFSTSLKVGGSDVCRENNRDCPRPSASCVRVQTNTNLKECKSLDLRSGGINVCQDFEGCSYRVYKYDISSNPYDGHGPNILMQLYDRDWVETGNADQHGKNGDGVSKKFLDWGACYLWDDCDGDVDCHDGPAGTWNDEYYENSENEITICDSSTSVSCQLVVCDF